MLRMNLPILCECYKRYVDHSQRVVNAPSVTISTPNGDTNNSDKDNKKKKLKAYRRSDSQASGGSSNRSRSATKELALPPDDSLMCPPCFVNGLRPELDINDGERLELKVQVKGDPDPQVIWTKNNKPLTSSEILEVKYKNNIATLTFNEIFPEDAGRYTCKATNLKGSIETSSNVKVKPMPKNKSNANGSVSIAPRIFKHTTSTMAKDGEPVKLECTITGDTRFDVVWLHNEKEIKPSKDFVYKTLGNNHVLEIVEVFPEDAGTYTCEAFNEVGECFSSCSLIVEVPGEETMEPKFKSFPKSVTCDKNTTATFIAEMENNIKLKQVTWLKDGKEVPEINMKNRISTNGKGKLCLDIMDCSQADSGQYAIIVRTEKGENKASFSLNVN